MTTPLNGRLNAASPWRYDFTPERYRLWAATAVNGMQRAVTTPVNGMHIDGGKFSRFLLTWRYP